jgi:hypothetical protein
MEFEMPSQVRRDFTVYENKNINLLLELEKDHDRPFEPMQHYHIFDYIESLSKDMAMLSAKTDNPLLSNLLLMAMLEAQNSKKIAQQGSLAS